MTNSLQVQAKTATNKPTLLKVDTRARCDVGCDKVLFAVLGTTGGRGDQAQFEAAWRRG